jgi:hypothetical protein
LPFFFGERETFSFSGTRNSQQRLQALIRFLKTVFWPGFFFFFFRIFTPIGCRNLSFLNRSLRPFQEFAGLLTDDFAVDTPEKEKNGNGVVLWSGGMIHKFRFGAPQLSSSQTPCELSGIACDFLDNFKNCDCLPFCRICFIIRADQKQ